ALLRLAEEVDEAGSDDAAVGVDGGGRGHGGEIADGRDGVAANADVTAVPRCAGTIDDPRVDDLEIERRWFGCGGASGEQKNDQQPTSDSQLHRIPLTRSSRACLSRISVTASPSTSTSG